MKKNTFFTPEDSIVLLAIISNSELGKRELSIGNIIAAYDYINHAIVTYTELKEALCRLSAAGHIQEVDTLHFIPSEKVLNAFVEHEKKNKKMKVSAAMVYIDQFLDIQSINNQGALNLNFEYPKFTQAIYQAACKVYLGK